MSKDPLISIVVAIYHPQINWLVELLDSLNAQTYKNLELIICDDGPDAPLEKNIVAKHILMFPWKLVRNEKNLGSNLTFERLTKMANGEYIAYCDQDDIWECNKISHLFQAIIGNTLAYCDMSVIDEAGAMMTQNMKKFRPRIYYINGSHLENIYMFRNCTAGCSMLVRSDIAKDSVPFPLNTVCDQWICMVAAHKGSIAFVPLSLVRYRQHAGNQTGILAGINSKEDYYEKRVLSLKERVDEFDRRFGVDGAISAFVKARVDRNICGIWRGKKLFPREAIFEMFLKWMPNIFFRLIIRWIS